MKETVGILSGIFAALAVISFAIMKGCSEFNPMDDKRYEVHRVEPYVGKYKYTLTSIENAKTNTIYILDTNRYMVGDTLTFKLEK